MNALTSTKVAKAIPASHVILARGECLAKVAAIPSNSVDLVLTDLPYGTTPCAWDKIIDLGKMWQELYRIGREDCVFVFTTQSPFTRKLINSNPNPDKHHRYEIIWDKGYGTNPLSANQQPLKSHEAIQIFCRKGARYNPQMTEGKPFKGSTRYNAKGEANGMHGRVMKGKDNHGTRYPLSILRIPRERGFHPTQKPVALMSWLIRTYSNPGQTVLDLTMGSGTTGVAAVHEGRNFIGFELGQEYMAIARKRIRAALAGLPDPLPPSRAKSKSTAAAKRTLRGGKGFGAGRQQRAQK